MVRANDIQEKLLHLVGWEQNYDTSDLKISDALTKSESGLYFQQIHPLLTLQNIACIAPDFKNIVFPEYDSEKEYKKGSIIKVGESYYKALRTVKGIRPVYNNLVKNSSFELFGPDREDVTSNPDLRDWLVDGAITLSGEAYCGDLSVFIRNSKTRRTYSQLISDIIPGHTYTFSLYIKTPQDSSWNNGYLKLGYGYRYTIIDENGESHMTKYVYSDSFLSSKDWAKVEFTFQVPQDIHLSEFFIRILFDDSFAATEMKALLIDCASLVDNDAIYSDSWAETNLFSEWLEGKTKASIQKAITRYCNEKIVEGTNKLLCENRTLFDGTGRLVDTIKNKKNLVGFEIIPVRAKGVTTKINKICLQFTKAGEYTLYLMHSSVNEPIKTIRLTKTRDNSSEWFTVDDIYLPYQSEYSDAGGSWYLCYSQSELPEGSQAIRKNKDWSKEPCGSCSRKELLAWTAWSKYLEIHPFFINEELIDIEAEGIHMWDVENNQYAYDTNYGLNLEVTVSCDITDFIIEQRAIFQDIIAKQVAVDMLREFAYNSNVRTNRHSINASRLDILYEVDGDSSSMKKSGLSHQLDKAFSAIKLSTSGIDRICLPCKNNGIKYRTV